MLYKLGEKFKANKSGGPCQTNCQWDNDRKSVC